MCSGANTVTFSTKITSTLDDVSVDVTISIAASAPLEEGIVRQAHGRLPVAMIETLRILGVINDRQIPEVAKYLNDGNALVS